MDLTKFPRHLSRSELLDILSGERTPPHRQLITPECDHVGQATARLRSGPSRHGRRRRPADLADRVRPHRQLRLRRPVSERAAGVGWSAARAESPGSESRPTWTEQPPGARCHHRQALTDERRRARRLRRSNRARLARQTGRAGAPRPALSVRYEPAGAGAAGHAPADRRSHAIVTELGGWRPCQWHSAGGAGSLLDRPTWRSAVGL